MRLKNQGFSRVGGLLAGVQVRSVAVGLTFTVVATMDGTVFQMGTTTATGKNVPWDGCTSPCQVSSPNRTFLCSFYPFHSLQKHTDVLRLPVSRGHNSFAVSIDCVSGKCFVVDSLPSARGRLACHLCLRPRHACISQACLILTSPYLHVPKGCFILGAGRFDFNCELSVPKVRLRRCCVCS